LAFPPDAGINGIVHFEASGRVKMLVVVWRSHCR
jgi:hypothetical protein